jgi:hypothetical protein
VKLSPYLLATGVAALPLTHKWDGTTTGRIVGVDPDDKPKLSSAQAAVGLRAIFAFGVAAAEWVQTRLSAQLDVTDHLKRIEAAWADTIDPRYGALTQPEYGPKGAEMRLAAPTSVASMILLDMHEHYRDGNRAGVYVTVLCMTLLAEHVAGKSPAFKKWVPDKLKQLATAYPNEKKTIAEEQPVARESLLSDAVLDAAATEAAQQAFLATLDPAQNGYLTPAATLEAAGVKNPYPGG